ncbi:MAG: ATP-binding protein [Desulfonauticus sp.]|nr:ATP-binding protein [Desulfonauticus sp.]
MKIEIFRRAPFVDREQEIDFLVEWFNRVPQRILWVYGPKSSGKTTVMEYVVENYLLKDKKRFWVKYFNLRETVISSYDSFLDTFFVELEKSESEKGARIGINVFGFKSEVWERIKEKKINLFKAFIEELWKIRGKEKRCVMIIDEIQKLRDLYIKNGNGARELLKEFLNFCVRLTKETHLSHVAILTSNTIFIERIYNDAKLKKTSEFWKVDPLKKERVREWLREEGFGEEEIGLVWEYLGGCIPDLIKVIEARKSGRDLKEHLEREAWLAYTEIVDFMVRGDFTEKDIEMFEKIAEEILQKGYFELTKEKREYLKIIETWAEKEILFYDPLELKVTGNSRVYEKAMERVVGEQ